MLGVDDTEAEFRRASVLQHLAEQWKGLDVKISPDAEVIHLADETLRVEDFQFSRTLFKPWPSTTELGFLVLRMEVEDSGRGMVSVSFER